MLLNNDSRNILAKVFPENENENILRMYIDLSNTYINHCDMQYTCFRKMSRPQRSAKTAALESLQARHASQLQQASIDDEQSDEEEAVSDISDNENIEEQNSDTGRDTDEDNDEVLPLPLRERIGVRDNVNLKSPSGQEWSRTPPVGVAGRTQRRNVVRHHAGITAYATNRVHDELSAFHVIFDHSMIDTILYETNRERVRVQGEDFKRISLEEMNAYIGLCILRGVYRGHNECLEELWSEEHGRKIFR